MEPCAPSPKPETARTRAGRSPDAAKRRGGATSIFSWADGEGVVHVVDSLDLVPARFRAHAEGMESLPVATYRGTFSKIGELAAGVQPAAHVGTAKAEGAGRVHAIIYSASWCGACKATKEYLRSLSVPIEERDIEKDRKALSELVALAGEDAAIPVTVIGSAVIGGFDRDALRRGVEAARRAPSSR
jgi:glutaredoxin